MIRSLSFLLFSLLSLLPLQAQQNGDQLLEQVRAQLPKMPLRMTGIIRSRDRDGEQEMGLITELHFGAPLPYCEYQILDGFGDLLIRVRVNWVSGKTFFEQWGPEGERLAAPKPDDEILDTGLTWRDLSLAYLWWPGAKWVDEDKVKTRNSYVLELPVPEGGTLKLWVDQKAFFVVKAEFYSPDGKRLRKMEVDSIKEIRKDFWILKDLLLRDYPNKRRIGIRFTQVDELNADGSVKEVPASE